MAIFSRRTLQRLLNENASFLKPEQLIEHVRRLNGTDRLLSHEWEVVVLNAFSKAGTVVHEPDLQGSGRPDLLFTYGTGFSFVADVITVSDTELHKKNPIDAFTEEFGRIIEKEGLRFRSFSYKVEADYSSRQPTRLRLPSKGRFSDDIFKTPRFKDWIKSIKQNPSRPSSCTFKTETIELILGYAPHQRFFSGNYPSYRTSLDRKLTDNRVYGALRYKREHLNKVLPEGSSYRGPRAIILCDGGCELMRQFTLNPVVSKFLRGTSSISFVVTVRIEESIYYNLPRKRRVTFTLHPNQRVMGEQNAALEQVLAIAEAAVPQPVTNPDSALNWLKSQSRHEGLSFRGGGSIKYGSNGPMEVKIPARALMELLAGKIDTAEFMTAHEFGPYQDSLTEKMEPGSNPFAAAFSRGQLIESISIEKRPDEDDDWITIRFKPDPAIARFAATFNAQFLSGRESIKPGKEAEAT